MAAKSPVSIRTREMIGVDQFSQRREVFDKHDTVFLPASPTNLSTSYREVDSIITSNHGKTTANFKRNSPGYSSMREPRDERDQVEFRQRKYSDNLTSELNKSDDADYRHTMTERTRRLSRMRREFLTSNLNESGDTSPFTRSATRCSLPARSGSIKYKIDSPTIYKFPFAEPYTPTPVRKLNFDSDASEAEEVKNDKENRDPDKQANLLSNEANKKLFEELLKRYSPSRKPVDWTLPPTRPKVVGTLPKANTDRTDSGKRSISGNISDIQKQSNHDDKLAIPNSNKGVKNGDSSRHIPGTEQSTDSQVSLTELAEKNDRVPELSVIQRQISRDAKRPSLTEKMDLTIPALIDKITAEGNDLESHKNNNKKVKRKRSFIDKLLGRKKETKNQ